MAAAAAARAAALSLLGPAAVCIAAGSLPGMEEETEMKPNENG